jgi:hypothetical protein
VRDGDSKVITDLTSEFTLTITDIDDVSTCVDMDAFPKTKTFDHIVAFDDLTDRQYIDIETTLNAEYGLNEAGDSPDVDCDVIYALQIYFNDEYMSMAKFFETLDADIWGDIRDVCSELELDQKTSHLTGYLKNKDFLDLPDGVTDPFLQDDGVTRALDLRVVAMVKESEVAGPATDKDELPSIEFFLKLTKPEASCMMNELILSEILPSGAERESDTFEY